LEDNIISTTNVVKSFGNNLALDGLSLQVPKAIVGFIGKNGSGKTTTIGILLGLLKPSKGKATFFGLDCWKESIKIRRRVGVMHEVNIHPRNFTGERFLEYIAHIYGCTQVKRQVKEMLEVVELSEAGDKPIKTYSAGMTRRLGLAQALIGDPEFVILDEPTANIDPLGRIRLLEKIKEIHKEQGTGFLISTHILSDLERVCNWLSIIDSGKIIDQGELKNLTKKHSAQTYQIEVSNPNALVKKLQELKIIEHVWIEKGKVHCKTKNTGLLQEKIPQIIASLKLRLRSFQPMNGTIEEIYKNTMGLNNDQ
jgi:ABC-2 type transport system ATP-binding protein